MPSLLQDFRLGFRQLIRRPSFSLIAILTLAIAIGSNSAIFAMVDAILLKSLPFQESSRLAVVSEALPQLNFEPQTFAAADFNLYRQMQQSFTAVGAFENRDYELSGTGRPERLVAARVTASVFPLLGMSALLGRTFSPDEDRPGSNLVVVSYNLWAQQFGMDPAIIGKAIHLDRIQYTVVGVMPKEFTFPLPGPALNSKPARLWVPMGFTPSELQLWGGRFNFTVIGRLQPGVDLAKAGSETAAMAPRIQEHYPAAYAEYTNGAKLALALKSYNEVIVGNSRVFLVFLAAAVFLILLVGCANLGALLLSRSIARQREMAIRAALGAGRWSLMRQLFIESLVLAAVGGVVGWVLAYATRGSFRVMLPANLPVPNQIEFTGSVVWFTLAVTLLACVLFGIIPALFLNWSKLNSALREGSRGATVGLGARRLQRLFVVAQFAVAVALAVSASLLLRSFKNLAAVDPGFRGDHSLALSIPLPWESYQTAQQIRSFDQQVLDRVGALPEVGSVALTSDLPLNLRNTGSFFIEDTKQGSPLTPPSVHFTWVAGDYLESLGMRLDRGRWFNADDRQGTMPVAVINETMAKQFWPNADPVGKRIHWAAGGPWLSIVGIVKDVRDEGLRIPSSPHVYKAFAQEDDAFVGDVNTGGLRNMELVARTKARPEVLVNRIETEIHSLDHELGIANVHTLEQDISDATARERFSALLISVFAALGIFLAAMGVYGVIAFAVSQQTADIGLRMALGAQKRDVMRMILKAAAQLAIAGVILGLCGAWGLTHYISNLLYGIKASDPLTFVTAALALLLVALMGACIPAWNATRIDPIRTLRHE